MWAKRRDSTQNTRASWGAALKTYSPVESESDHDRNSTLCNVPNHSELLNLRPDGTKTTSQSQLPSRTTRTASLSRCSGLGSVCQRRHLGKQPHQSTSYVIFRLGPRKIVAVIQAQGGQRRTAAQNAQGQPRTPAANQAFKPKSREWHRMLITADRDRYLASKIKLKRRTAR